MSNTTKRIESMLQAEALGADIYAAGKAFEDVAPPSRWSCGGAEDGDFLLGGKELQAFEDAVLAALKTYLPDGSAMFSHPGSLASTYVDVVAPGKESVLVRISNHAARHRGTAVWSFDTADPAKTHRMGIEVVADAVADADDDPDE